jgi:hypothetical protein
MFLRIIRVVFGFVLACLAAGLTMVLFVYTPVELANLPSDEASQRASEAGLLSLAAATHSAIFAAPFALIAAAIGEWRGIGSWMYYVLVGVLIAGIGFLAQYSSEAVGEASIVNTYALTAFLVTGFVAGAVYWLFSGRYADWPWPDDESPSPQATQPAPPATTTPGPDGAAARAMPRSS